MEPRALWQYETEEIVFPRATRYVIRTAYFDPEEDQDIAVCWSEEVAKEIVRLHNEHLIRRAGGT